MDVDRVGVCIPLKGAAELRVKPILSLGPVKQVMFLLLGVLDLQSSSMSFKYQLLVRSSLVTRSSALSDGCQPRPDATLTEPVQFESFIQLSRGSFAASV